MRVVPALAFALSIAALVGCDRVGRSVLGGPEAVIPHDDGVVGMDAVDSIDASESEDVVFTTDRSDVPVDCSDGQRAVSNVCVMEGVLTFTLTWDRPGDMDLHVVTPGGSEIYFMDRILDDGELDVDDRVGTGPENIFWAIPPTAGDYTVCVVPFNISGPTHYTVSVRANGMMVQQWTGTRNETNEGLCFDMSPNFVGTYTVTDPGIPDM